MLPHTPITLEAARKEPLVLELHKEGYETTRYELYPRLHKGVLFADAMLLGIPYIVDGGSSSMYSMPAKEANFRLYRTFPKDRQLLELPVALLECEIPKATVVGRAGVSKLTLSSFELYDLSRPRQGTVSILRGLANSFVDANLAQAGTARGDDDVARAKMVLRPLVKHVEMNLNKPKGWVDGVTHLDVDWRFYSGVVKDSLLFTVNTVTDRYFSNVRSSEVMGLALQDAARCMLDEEELYERLAEVRFKGLDLSKGENVILTQPVPIKFEDRRSMFPALVKAVVTVEMKDGHGSGFMITNDGYLMTNAHVVGKEAVATVRFEQGFSLEGQVVKVNRDSDLALIKVPGEDLPALTLGDDTELMLGEELFAIGTPLDERLGQSISRGIMSGRREIDGRRYLQTDVSIKPGNSGGPLIDENGRVVGVATMKISATGVEGIGFGVPITTAMEMLNITFKP